MKKNVKNLETLSIKEMKTIEGGDWIFDLGKAAKRLACGIADAIANDRSSVVLG